MVDGWVLDSIGNLVFQYILGFAIGFHQSQHFPNNSMFFSWTLEVIGSMTWTLRSYSRPLSGDTFGKAGSWRWCRDDFQFFWSWWCCFKSFGTRKTTKEKAGSQSCGCIRAVMSLSLSKSPRHQAWLFMGWSSQKMNLKMEVRLIIGGLYFSIFFPVRVHSWRLEAAWARHQNSATTLYLSEISQMLRIKFQQDPGILHDF